MRVSLEGEAIPNLRSVARLVVPTAQLRAKGLPLGVGQRQAGDQAVVRNHPALVARL